MKYICIYFFFVSHLYFHAGHIAEFKYFFVNDELMLEFMIDKEELQSFNFDKSCDMNKMTALCISSYINKHNKLTIDKKSIQFELENAYTKNNHLIVLLKANKPFTSLREIHIENNCFYEFNTRFKNRVLFHFEGFQKSFLLNKSKNIIKVR